MLGSMLGLPALLRIRITIDLAPRGFISLLAQMSRPFEGPKFLEFIVSRSYYQLYGVLWRSPEPSS